MLFRSLLLSLFLKASSAEVFFKPQNAFESLDGPGPSFPVDLSSFTDNRAFGMSVGDADFDETKSCFPAQHIPPSNFTYNGFNFDFPEYKPAGNDNVISTGQEISIPRGKYFAVSMLAASENGMAEGTINATYSDGSTHSNPLLVPAWWTWPYPAGGDLIFPFYYSSQSVDYNRSNIFQTVNWLDTSTDIVSLALPNITGGSDTEPGGDDVDTRLHIFSLSLWPAIEADEDNSPSLDVQYARTTNKWVPETDKTQIVEVLVSNVGDRGWILSNNTVTVNVVSDGLKTVQPGTVKRLRPGDQAIVEIGVENKDGVEAGETGEAMVVLSGVDVDESYSFEATYGIVDYDPTYESIYAHESPSWYNGAKYGIFIHWGLYAVPGWGNSGDNETYAEWYWWNMNSGPDTEDRTYQYHLETYGVDFVYDDFIPDFTASEFDPKEWVDLFADAGAKYFVLTSKHHDGYALMDLPENITKRTSVAQFPHKDIVKELFDASKEHQPDLHRATYFSLPEFFHPDYQEYGFGSWPGGNATNPYTNETLEYTGYVPVDDFVTDVIVPEMNELADRGVEIMWCDIGGPNMTTDFAASWFNNAAMEGKQVAMNARCGLPGDFDTPEYTSYAGTQRRKWETSLGMDPYSYGYNRATPVSAYMNASTIVTSLIDIVSKNGNFLLDIGPKADGTIVDVEKKNLREGGAWIKDHSEAIFDTSFWFVTSSEGENIRFTTTPDAFYISVLAKPEGGVITLESPIPWVDGDNVLIVGGDMDGEVVPSKQLEDGSVELEVSDETVEADEWAWVFKIEY